MRSKEFGGSRRITAAASSQSSVSLGSFPRRDRATVWSLTSISTVSSRAEASMRYSNQQVPTPVPVPISSSRPPGFRLAITRSKAPTCGQQPFCTPSPRGSAMTASSSFGGGWKVASSIASEPVTPRGIVDQDLRADRGVRRPHRDGDGGKDQTTSRQHWRSPGVLRYRVPVSGKRALAVDRGGGVLPSLRRASHRRGLVWETSAARVWRKGLQIHFRKARGPSNHKPR